jgi:hypothetical protein
MCCCNNQNNVIYWNATSYSTSTTGSDILLATLDTTSMPTGTSCPAFLLPSDGSYLEIQTAGAFVNNSERTFKITIGSTTNTIFFIPGVVTSAFYTCRTYLTRTSYNTVRWHSILNFNDTQVKLTAGGNFTADLTVVQPIRFYINNSTANSLVVSEIKITKFIK